MTFLVLFNGLWQGALLTGAAYAVCCTLPKRDAATRYALWLTTLVAIAVIPVVTTVLRVPFALPRVVAASPTATHVTMSLAALSTHAARDGTSVAALVPWLLVLWGIGAAWNLYRLSRGFLHMEGIARDARPPDAAFAPNVFISDDVDVPLVAGVAFPRILIPATMLATLEEADLQRIVEHETAHIRRNDPPFNLLARVIEACLFFNPAVRLVGRNLVAEREAACDDIAIAQSGESLDYAACLAAIAQMRCRHVAVMTPSGLGFRASLLSRIERLHSSQPRITRINRNAFGGIVMLFAVIALALQTLTPALALTASVAGDAAPQERLVAATCAQPNLEAAVVTPQPPVLPHGLRLSGSAQAIVTIAPTGRVASARILHSSGNGAVDAALLTAARQSTYRAKRVDCLPVQGTYVFRIDFKP